MSDFFLTDNHGRPVNYLRLSVTDRCNFRCYYCMPEEGMQFAPRAELLTFDEMLLLCTVFCGMGITKIRITGGEPFLRNGILPFLQKLSRVKGLDEITVTTNGALWSRHINALKDIGIRHINISLDALDRQRFYAITRRDSFDTVYAGVFQLLEAGFNVKLNCVVAEGKNTQDIIPFVELTRQHRLSVRFLEEMPFNGSSSFSDTGWNYARILNHISSHYPEVVRLQSEASSTSVNYTLPGYIGTFGIIPSFSRTFCGTCNRIRLSATGDLRTCLYGPPAGNLRNLIRNGGTEADLVQEILLAVSHREKDGFAAEAAGNAVHHSMSVLGG